VKIVPVSEIQSLKDLYETCGGEAWNWSDDVERDGPVWNFSLPLDETTPCKEGAVWQQVVCSQPSGSTASIQHILELNLTQFGVHGTLPMSIGNLSALRFLSFKENSLRGRLPATLSLLSALETLWVDFNSLTGHIPSIVGDMGALRDLDMDNNQFTGPLPSEVGKLSALQYMDVDNNFLSGTIPPAMQYMRNLGKQVCHPTLFVLTCVRGS
jgi:Leucine-rich repeat (LRR) protein